MTDALPTPTPTPAVAAVADEPAKSAALLAHERDLEHHFRGGIISRIILGGQDGIVNVLGVLLGVGSATGDPRVVLIAGIATAITESVSMLAVAYTSARADEDYYRAQLQREEREIREMPDVETEEIRIIYYKKGFRGADLERVVRQITSDPVVWRDVMMREELGLEAVEMGTARREAAVVGVSVAAGSTIPLLPFFGSLPQSGIYSLHAAMLIASGLSLGALFAAGWIKARLTTGTPWKSGLEMGIIAGLAAAIGYFVGRFLGVAV